MESKKKLGGLEELVKGSNPGKLNMVTGALNYNLTGRYIAKELLSRKEKIRILTGNPNPDKENPFGDQVEVFSYNFDKPKELVKSLLGVDTFYITYWIRYLFGDMTFDRAIDNLKTLIGSAQEAKVKRIVYISITNADENSPFPYFRGKGIVERIIIESGIDYAIPRPALLFGKESKEGILINNIAWCLREFPFFAIPGYGRYKIQPIYAEDLAELAVDAAHSNKNMIIDVIGPETFTFNELVHLIKDKIGSNSTILPFPPKLALFFSERIGRKFNDTVITEEEMYALMDNKLYSSIEYIKGKTRLSSWLEKEEIRESIGTKYISLKTHLKMHYV